MYELTGADHISVNSYHHQAIKTLAPTLKEMALSEDGLIEAVFMPEYRFLWAVQWHPEFSYETDKTSRAIFHKLVEAAGCDAKQ